jgi:hypothetical protein
VFLARLAGMDPRIDDAGGEVKAAAIDRLDAVGGARREQVGTEVGDLAVADQDGAGVLGVGRRIDDAGIDESGRAGVRRAAANDAAAIARCSRRRSDRVAAAADQGFEAGHADGDAHLDLLVDDAAVEVVGNLRIDLDAAVHRARDA